MVYSLNGTLKVCGPGLKLKFYGLLVKFTKIGACETDFIEAGKA